jgi:hypothetical protein
MGEIGYASREVGGERQISIPVLGRERLEGPFVAPTHVRVVSKTACVRAPITELAVGSALNRDGFPDESHVRQA